MLSSLVCHSSSWQTVRLHVRRDQHDFRSAQALRAVERHVDGAEPEPLMDGHGTCVAVVEDNLDVGLFATQPLAELG